MMNDDGQSTVGTINTSRLSAGLMSVVTIAYDLETTGLDVLRDRIVQIAAVVIGVAGEPAIPIPHFASLVNPGGRRMNPRAAAVTGLSDSKLENAPNFPHVWRRLLAHVGAHVGHRAELRLVGHNSRAFDDLMLCAELRRFGRALGDDGGDGDQSVAGFGGAFASVACADTLCAARKSRKRCGAPFPPDNKLSSLYAAATGRALDGAHDALVDTAAVVAVLAWPPVADAIEFEPWAARVAAYEARAGKRREGKRKNPHRRTTTVMTVAVAARAKRTAAPTDPEHADRAASRVCDTCGVVFSRFFPDHACRNAIQPNLS